MDFNNIPEDWKKEAKMLATIEKKNPFTVPENYFQSLSDNIEAEISSERLKGAVSQDGFTIPNNYFEQFQASIQDKISIANEIPPSVIKLKFRWVKYAAAACITIAVSIATFLNKRNNSIENQLHNIPETEIIHYLQLNTEASDTPIIIENLSSNPKFLDLNTEVSQEDIEQYINSTTL